MIQLSTDYLMHWLSIPRMSECKWSSRFSNEWDNESQQCLNANDIVIYSFLMDGNNKSQFISFPLKI
jgi:hypothetical protein